MRNWSYTIKEGEYSGKTLWSGRYCAVCAIVIRRFNGEFYVLANQRGNGCPDFQGYWNLPCGFIEADETGEQAACRECFEETGVFVYPNQFVFNSVETDPTISNNGNITLRYCNFSDAMENLPTIGEFSGEKNEVSKAAWINTKHLENYKWAFHHKELLNIIIQDLKRKLYN